MSAGRKGRVRVRGIEAGMLEETENGFVFRYDSAYLAEPDVAAISLTLPLRPEPFKSPHLFPFFEGLLAEGSLRELQCRTFRIDPDDSFGLLLKTAASEVIGCVTVEPLPSE